jgi:hypothetical protein
MVMNVALMSTFLFGPFNIVSAWLVGRGKISGWVVLVAVQLGMVAFGIATGYWGFVMNLGMVAVGVLNYVKWRNKDKLYGLDEVAAEFGVDLNDE